MVCWKRSWIAAAGLVAIFGLSASAYEGGVASCNEDYLSQMREFSRRYESRPGQSLFVSGSLTLALALYGSSYYLDKPAVATPNDYAALGGMAGVGLVSMGLGGASQLSSSDQAIRRQRALLEQGFRVVQQAELETGREFDEFVTALISSGRIRSGITRSEIAALLNRANQNRELCPAGKPMNLLELRGFVVQWLGT